MVVGVVIDGDGMPLRCEMWPGKAAVFRSEMRGCAGKVFQAAGVAVPPAVRFARNYDFVMPTAFL